MPTKFCHNITSHPTLAHYELPSLFFIRVFAFAFASERTRHAYGIRGATRNVQKQKKTGPLTASSASGSNEYGSIFPTWMRMRM
jgi:hypothetical protein